MSVPDELPQSKEELLARIHESEEEHEESNSVKKQKVNTSSESSSPELDLKDVCYSKLDRGIEGVSLGQEELFLEIARQEGKWRLRVLKLFSEKVEQVTAWVTLLNLETLRSSSNAKPIRETLKEKWENSSKILEKIIIQIENHVDQLEKEQKYRDSVETNEESNCNKKQSDYDPETEEKIEAEVDRIREADNQLDALGPYLDNIVVGEQSTKEATVVLLASSKIPHPEAKQIILLSGDPGAGKSTVMHALTNGFRVKNVGRFSQHALDYTSLEGYEILCLQELGNMDEEKQGISTLKFLSNDDRGYTVETTIKDESTGGFTTEQRTIPAITVISTTTRLSLESQFERRLWPLPLDESKEQTKRVAEWSARQETEKAEKLLGQRKLTSYEFSTAVYSRYMQKFEPVNIIIPFPQTLTGFLGYESLRVRGDVNRLLIFVKLYAMFNVKRLRKIAEKTFLLSTEVAAEALKIVLEPLQNMMSKIDRRTREVFDAIKSVKGIKWETDSEGEANKKEVRLDVEGASIDKSAREKIAVWIKKSEKTVRAFLNQLEESGYVSGDGRKPKTFTLLYDVEEIERKFAGFSAKIDSANDLTTKMNAEAQEWVKPRLENFSLQNGSVMLPEWKDTSGQSNNDAQKEHDTHIEKQISNPDLRLGSPFFAETVSQDRQIEELPKIRSGFDALQDREKLAQETKVEKTCGQCVLWHKPGCTFPNSEYTCVAPTNVYAIDCKDFTEKEH